MMAIQKVILLGANGKLGSVILERLELAQTFHITVLKRSSSTSNASYPGHVQVVTVADSLPFEDLKAQFQGQDAVIICIPVRNVNEHIHIAEAAEAAGVKRYMPADFGSVDSNSYRAQELVPLFGRKVQIQTRLRELASASEGNFTWTSLVAGHFFDWGLKANFLHFDLKAKKAYLLDRGETRWSASTLERIGDAVVRVLQCERETANNMLFIQSLCTSQNDVLNALEQATASEWEVCHTPSDKFIEAYKAKADAGDPDAIEELVFVLGTLEADWTQREDFANPLLGLEDENLGEVIAKFVSPQKTRPIY